MLVLVTIAFCSLQVHAFAHNETAYCHRLSHDAVYHLSQPVCPVDGGVVVVVGIDVVVAGGVVGVLVCWC